MAGGSERVEIHLKNANGSVETVMRAQTTIFKKRYILTYIVKLISVEAKMKNLMSFEFSLRLVH